MMTSAMFSSATDEWATPQGFFDRLNEEFHFTLDPCALPTLATAKVIAANIKAINEAMLAIGGSVVCGWLWTSTIKKENLCAFVVRTNNGGVYYESRYTYDTARAVSAFHFEEFNF